MPSLGDAYVDVRADTKGFARDLDRGVTSSTQAATTKMGGLTSAVKGVGIAAAAFIGAQAVSAVADFAKEAINAASDLNESINAINVSFGDNADEILELGEAAAQNLGLSNAEFNALAVSVGAFTDKIAAGLGQEVPEVMDTLTTRIADFASVMNLDVDAAFEKFRSGLAGESEPLRQFGIDVSAATVEQVALAEGIIETGEEMTEADKVTARYLTIMEQTEKVAGDFANTSEDLANQQRILNAEFENQKAEIGQRLTPAVVALQRAALDLLPVVADLAIEIAEIAETAGSALGPLGELIGLILEGRDAAGVFGQSGLATVGMLLDLVSGTEAAVVVNEDYQQVLDLSNQAILTGTTNTLELSEAQSLYTESSDEAATAAAELAAEVTEYWGEQATAAAQTDLATEALRGNREAQLALIDPIFGAVSAVQNLNETQAELAELQADSTTSAADLAEAELEVALALLEAQTEMDRLDPSTLEASIGQIAAILGKSKDEVRLLLEELGVLDGKEVTTFIRINEIVRRETFNINDPTKGRQHGGSVSALTPYRVGEAGPELFVPSVPGHIIPNHQLGGFSANIVVNMTGGSRGDAAIIANEIERRLERLANSRVVR